MSHKTRILNVRLVVPKSKQDLDQYIDSLSRYFGTLMSVMEGSVSDKIQELEFANVAEPVIISSEVLLHNPSEVDFGYIHEAVQRAISSIQVQSVTPLEMTVEDYDDLCERTIDINDPLKVYSSITHHILTGKKIESLCGAQTAIAIVDMK